MPTVSEQDLQRELIVFYSQYANEIELIKKYWELELTQLSLAYTYQNKLPKEAVTVSCRIKSIESVMQKLKRLGNPQFDVLTEVINDLVGARITCWFIDDCYGIFKSINASSMLEIIEGYTKDYNASPKLSGYRALHCLAQRKPPNIGRTKKDVPLIDDIFKCEIQIRTKLQDSWADITHEFHYKAILAGVENETYESFMSDIANRLGSEDAIFVRLRKLYQNLTDSIANGDVKAILSGELPPFPN